MIKVKRALISVSDKTGLVEFAKGLQNFGVEIISTGGTASLLKANNIPAIEVSDYTGFPEMLDGRVKTLHPAIHGGLLAVRSNPEHLKQLKDHKIGLIDMVVINLYPFEKTVQKKSVSLEEAIENIDIGGPSMIRSAAKNFKNVAVVCSPNRYKEILKELDVNSGILSDTVLVNLALEAFQMTSRYDGIIYGFLNERLRSSEFSALPKEINLRFSKIQDLRYGENPHQKAAFYSQGAELSGFARMKQLHGKELSFNNILDLNAAVDVVKEFDNPAAVIIKHNNPAGVSEDQLLAKAYQNAYKCDPLSAFGGIIGLNRKVDVATAELIAKSGFMECIIAPGYEKEALKILTQKKNVRIIEFNFHDQEKDACDYKKVHGGLLLQEKDERKLNPSELKVVTKIKPTAQQVESLLFGWKIVKHVKSNAIVLVKGKKTVGIGCGQTSRVESALLAVKKAAKEAKGSLLISDAFIPKEDTVLVAAKAGVKAIIQTGGSIADQDVIKTADKVKIAMVTTGIRHFKH
ncbi:MAG TPA: bifunctional phosphoribosylaminoimidazolecarboxamide formyltransferase/IMP cyclohydrolase [Candidatus Omnitrophota bacterium]|nr:bifunctional phosphoribosylaminoimidazolecarboxamide formyltransferase/IMP cyclohydrolase [Candidatus Omnitrophota bacterium]HPD84461.1 bifunctional phosphoribosylaminoimidazolecarboxamide formyltransferase/IMP cyclohydrolase [Candidatus Omnitrophota bacterium]HRZ03319.1 bifunctional phosphoribosylaminoimidazolecarboxamide formyltransferase/IMP cyclohydrolase [Candidatus Omnitrophota bacterium]